MTNFLSKGKAMSESRVTCKICGAKVHSIQIHIRNDHEDWTLEKYSETYPGEPLLSPIALAKIAEAGARKSPTPDGTRNAPRHAAKALHEAFGLGAAKGAMNPRGEPIPITVLHENEHPELVPEIDTNYVYELESLKNTLLGIELNMPTYVWGHAGTGKCLGKGTPVLMFNGSIKPVETVETGDLVMGPDSLPRLVSGITSGREMMYRVTPTKGESYIVNESHILSLRMTNGSENNCGIESGSIVNISVKDWLGKNKSFKQGAKGWRTGVNFDKKAMPLGMEPYFLGLWLGDGNTANPIIWSADKEVKEYLAQYAARLGLTTRHDGTVESSGLCGVSICKTGGARHSHPLRVELVKHDLLGNKHIPHVYKTASREDRLQLLAGIIDTDGSLDCGGFALTLKVERLMDDVIFIARSLGFAAYKKAIKKTCVRGDKRVEGDYFQCFISGDVDEIPTKIERKKASPRLQKKNVLNVGITVDPIGEGDYYGFSLLGSDRLFLLGDFTVTHNTTLLEQVCARTQRPMLRVQHTANTEESHILGQWTAKGGETRFELGPLPLAMKHGWMYLADEYDFAMPSVLSVYQPVLEGKSLVIKEADAENRIIRPHPNFRFVATGNTNGAGDETGLYQGTNIQNAANYDRFAMVIQVLYMKPELEAQVLVNQARIPNEDATRIVDFANRVRESYDGNKISSTISPRTLINAAKIGQRRGSYRAGIGLSFTSKLSRVDREVCDGLAQRVFG